VGIVKRWPLSGTKEKTRISPKIAASGEMSLIFSVHCVHSIQTKLNECGCQSKLLGDAIRLFFSNEKLSIYRVVQVAIEEKERERKQP
jgi:hypothetical protein